MGSVSTFAPFTAQINLRETVPEGGGLYQCGDILAEALALCHPLPPHYPAVPRRARIQGSWMVVSLNSRLESHEEQDVTILPVVSADRGDYGPGERWWGKHALRLLLAILSRLTLLPRGAL